jgi:1-acyl-sn-glycerol-3-phosphate acyltransferase
MVEVPILFSELLPRPVIGVAKIESWDNWFLRPIFDLFHVIPIKRGEADMEAMHSMIKVLDEGYLLGMSPEGTQQDWCLSKQPRSEPGQKTTTDAGAHWGET